MGTNFYLKRKLNKAEKDEIKAHLYVDNYDKIKELLNKTDNIHIGKRSGGWQFLWNANNFQYFKPNEESIKQFLQSGQIVDEYDNEFTYEQFWKELEGFLDKGLDSEEYAKIEPKSAYHELSQYRQEEYQEFTNKHQVNVNSYGEFYIPFEKHKLRFTTYSEFC